MRLAEFLRTKLDVAMFPRVRPSAARDSKELILSEMVPYKCHYDDETVLTADDGLMQVIKIAGLPFESLSRAAAKRFERERNTALRAIAESYRAVYVHTIRREAFDYPEGEPETWFARHFNANWREHLGSIGLYTNDLYITIVDSPFRHGAVGYLDRIFSAVDTAEKHLSDEHFVESLEARAERLNSAANSVVAALGAYGPQKLRGQRLPDFGDIVPAGDAMAAVKRFGLSWHDFVGQEGERASYPGEAVLDFLGPEVSEIGSFLYYLVNLQHRRVPLSDQPLNETLSDAWLDAPRMYLGNTLRIEHVGGSRVAAVLSMSEWPARSPSRMLNKFLDQDVEFIITQSFFFTDRINDAQKLRGHRRHIDVNHPGGEMKLDKEEIERGMQSLSRGHDVNGLHHLSVLVHVPESKPTGDRRADWSRTVVALNEAVESMNAAFIGINVKPRREWLGAENFYWSMMPGQSQRLIGRRGRIKSSNFAGFASLYNFARGRAEGSAWGPPIMPLETEGRTQYDFNFHRDMEGYVAAHLVMSGDTGQGKTALMCALTAMADKARPRVFWFDNREGAAVFMSAMGARQTLLTPTGKTGWNPLQLPDTEENRAYLLDLMRLMRTCYGGEASAEDVRCFKQAIEENYALPQRDRRLSNVAWCFGQGELAKAMAVWHSADGQVGANAAVFDNETDSFDLDSCRHYCFEMRLLMKGIEARPELPVVLSYPLHKIEQAMEKDGRPFMVVLDEGQNLVRHPFWQERIDNYMMTLRRKNGMLAFLTPDVQYLYKYTEALIRQAATQIHFPAGQASYEHYVKGIGLPVADFEFLRDTPATDRKFLLRRGQVSVRLRFDLGSKRMKPFIAILSSNTASVQLMKKITAEIGSDDPQQWVPILMQRAMAENTHNLKAA